VPDDLPPRIHFSREDEEFAESFLRRHGFDDRPPVAISPVASSSLKRWPIDRLAAVADRLIETTGGPLLLFCGPQQEVAALLLGAMGRREKVVSVGRIHLQRIGALLARCSFFLCNDTGLMHLSSAVGTPVVAIFGPTSPRVYLPVETASTAVGGSDGCPFRKTAAFGPPACIVADRCLISAESCIDQVTVEQVTVAIEPYLRQHRQAPGVSRIQKDWMPGSHREAGTP
jgi:ADP-heptose:LPS heptosyltransferase